MINIVKKVIQRDTSLCKSSSELWRVQRDRPEIRQIYGSYLPPPHLKTIEGLVAKDFAFPADAVIPKMISLCIDNNTMKQLYAAGERIKPESFVLINDSIKIRAERRGAVIYTSYFSGFYLNEAAYKVLKLCNRKVKVKQITSELGYSVNTIIDFLARLLALGIVNVCIK